MKQVAHTGCNAAAMRMGRRAFTLRHHPLLFLPSAASSPAVLSWLSSCHTFLFLPLSLPVSISPSHSYLGIRTMICPVPMNTIRLSLVAMEGSMRNARAMFDMAPSTGEEAQIEMDGETSEPRRRAGVEVVCR